MPSPSPPEAPPVSPSRGDTGSSAASVDGGGQRPRRSAAPAIGWSARPPRAEGGAITGARSAVTWRSTARPNGATTVRCAQTIGRPTADPSAARGRSSQRGGRHATTGWAICPSPDAQSGRQVMPAPLPSPAPLRPKRDRTRPHPAPPHADARGRRLTSVRDRRPASEHLGQPLECQWLGEVVVQKRCVDRVPG